MSAERHHIRLGHSPDPDDAFMFYPLAKGLIDTGSFEFEHVLRDIQTLNEWAMEGRLEVTAISIHAYPHVRSRYRLLNCGASMGDGYGPLVVAREPLDPEDLRGKTIAVPGEMTTAFLALNLCLGRETFDHRIAMFDQIPALVAEGQVDAGLLIHEGQLTYGQLDLHCIVDLGVWWREETGLPLPLGGNVVRRDLGEETCLQIGRILKRSIQIALERREEAVKYALQFGRDLSMDLTDQFVGMYVNEWTLHYGPRGREAVAELLKRGYQAGLCPDPGNIDLV
jgi:1,4-dihydroxy-6-naphthoate synthase